MRGLGFELQAAVHQEPGRGDPERLHFAAHSHHLWPDASFEGQVECWEDAAALADNKWDKVMGEVWPEAQAHVAAELGTRRSVGDRLRLQHP